MIPSSAVDGVLVQWGDRLFYPGNRIVKVTPLQRLDGLAAKRAASIRARIAAVVAGRAPEVIVKVHGGARGMSALAAHFRYISKNGELEFEDDRGIVRKGKEALHDLVEQWRLGGSLIGATSHRKEAHNLLLSTPRGTPPQIVLQAVRQFAQTQFHDHRYVMVLHDHQDNPHVHLCVRAESMGGKRLYPGYPDWHRWREAFAQQLRACGVDAQATRQSTRGENRRSVALWRFRESREQQSGKATKPTKSGETYQRNRVNALEAWAHIATALKESDQDSDRELAQRIRSFVLDSSFAREHRGKLGVEVQRSSVPREVNTAISRARPAPDLDR